MMIDTHTELMSKEPQILERRLGAIFNLNGSVTPSANWRVGIAVSDGRRYAFAVTNSDHGVDRADLCEGELDDYLVFHFGPTYVRDMVKEGVLRQ